MQPTMPETLGRAPCPKDKRTGFEASRRKLSILEALLHMPIFVMQLGGNYKLQRMQKKHFSSTNKTL